MNNIFCIETNVTNNFLLKGKSGHLLIDTGFGSDFEDFLNKFKDINVDIQNIKYILLTHHHTDHIAFLSKMKKRCDAKLIVHKNEVEYLVNGVQKLGQYKNSFLVKAVSSIMSKINSSEPVPIKIEKDDCVLENDDSTLLKEIGIDGIILHTPGHTNGSISVVLSDGNAFVGDTVMNFFLSRPDPFVFEDINKVYESWEKLFENGAKIIHPSHGKPLNINILKKHLKKVSNQSL